MKAPTGKVKVDKTELVWLKATYHLHTFAYRDPRSSFASGSALPVVSPTTVLLGVASTLFSIGRDESALACLSVAHECQVMIDSPDGVVFFRAFHQLRRYETEKYGANPRFGLTKINQGTREYGLVDGTIGLYVGVPIDLSAEVEVALTNLRHLGTHDSLCSLVDSVEVCQRPEPTEVLYLPQSEMAEDLKSEVLNLLQQGVMMVTLSRFDRPIEQTLDHWHLAGGKDTEHVSYLIPGRYEGTTRGKIYRR